MDLWVSTDGGRGNDAIDWYRAGNLGSECYLFLPGSVEISSLKIGFTGADDIIIQDRIVHNGDPVDFLQAGGQYTVNAGKRLTLYVMQGSPGYPAIYITTESGSLTDIHESKDHKEPGYLLFVSSEGSVEYDGALKYIKIRGNSSTAFNKKNYQIKLAEGTSLAGMGKNKTWVLTGNFKDRSLLRNQITLDMAEYAGLQYTPGHLFAELYINHAYMGFYLFGEKVMIDDERVDIADLEELTQSLNGESLSQYSPAGSLTVQPGKYKAYNIPADPDDITGGYLVEFETYTSRYTENASAYHTTRKNTVVVKSPEYCSVAQMEYISGYMQRFEDAIFASDGIDPATGKHYTELANLDSLVNKYLVEEISKNYDGNYSSMFFYKNRDEIDPLLYAGPCWDYDSSYGSYAREDNASNVLNGEKLWIASANEKVAKYWWPALYNQKDFYASVTARYQAVFRNAIEILLGKARDDAGKLLSIDEYAERIQDSAAMNFVRWPISKKATTAANTGDTFEKNIDYLKNFLTVRETFLDQLWLGQTP